VKNLKIENYYEWREKLGREENGQVFYGSEEPPSQKKKRHKKENNNGHVSKGE
jgi:hypothetical protein